VRRPACLRRRPRLIAAAHRELNREEVYARLYMLPHLLAEEDRDIYRREMAQVAREREIMKDVEGWNVRPPRQRRRVHWR
jgi:hypothetical protein